MRKLPKIIIPALIAATMLGAAGTASAQPYGGPITAGHAYPERHSTPGRAQAIRAQLDELQRRVERNDRRDRISGRESAGLRHDIASVREQFRRFNRDGLNNREYRGLRNRIANIRSRLHMERGDWKDRRN